MGKQSNSESTDQDTSGETRRLQAVVREQVREDVGNRSFNNWYHERQVEENILEGKPYFNGASPPPDPERHSPSKILQCHRKVTYRDQNAPKEGAAPDGLFWIGDEFEEGIIVPYLQDVATSEATYIRNSVWINTEIETDSGALQLRGTTDPVLTDEEGNPLLVTEVKTTSSLSHLSGPKQHHKAQLHAYLYGLTQEHEYQIHDGVAVYGARDTLDIKAYPVTFDEAFWWETVVDWMQTQTQHRQTESLPPRDPVFSWECDFCSFKHRCGQAESPYKDNQPAGLLPVFAGYRKQQLEEYLDAHADAGVKLTPTLANKFPKLATEYGSYDWQCPRCESSFAWDAVECDESGEPPVCPVCVEQGDLVTLSGPDPDEQVTDSG